jgi:hypothetical protein
VNTKIAVKSGPFFFLPQNQITDGKGALGLQNKDSAHLKAEVQGPRAAAKLEESRASCAAARAGL